MEQKIINLYKTNSINNITNMIGISKHHVKKILSDNGIKLRTNVENLLLARGVTDFQLFSKESMYKMYHDDKMTVHEIAKILGIHHRNVYPWLKKYNIPTIASGQTETIYYVYALCNPLVSGIWNVGNTITQNEPFYIGYGKHDRCFEHMKKYHLRGCNGLKNKLISHILSTGNYPIIHKLKENLSLKEAVKYESEMIKQCKSNNINITNKSNGGEIGGRYVKIVAKYKPDYINFQHKLVKMYDTLEEATTLNGLSKICFKGISGGYVYERYEVNSEVKDILYRKLSDHTINVFADVSLHKNAVCVYDINGNFLKLSKPIIKIDNIIFRMPDGTILHFHHKQYYCVYKKYITWDYKQNILQHTKYMNGRLTIQRL